jgi:chemotaxis protein MotB
MAKRKPEEASGGSPAWMSTFSDLMNLLLCFFVLLFSMSTIDSQKFQELSAALAATFSVLPSGGSVLTDSGVLVSSGASQLNALSEYYNNVGLNSEGEITDEISGQEGEGENDSESLYEQLQEEGLSESEQMAEMIEAALEARNVADYVEVTATSEYVLLNLNGAILFDSGSSEFKSGAQSIVDKVADSVKQYDANTITIEGHTDNVPINTAKYPDNMMLSIYRAYTVFDYFVNEKGFDPASLTSSGRGEAVPVASNSTAEGRAQNRRVEIKIYNSIYSKS